MLFTSISFLVWYYWAHFRFPICKISQMRRLSRILSSPLLSSSPLSTPSSLLILARSMQIGFYFGQSWLCVVPINSVGAGREYEYTLGPHWQVSLIIIGQVGHRGSKSLLTLMIKVPAHTQNSPQKNCCPGAASKRKERFLFFFELVFIWSLLKETYKDFIDRWSLDLIMSICGFRAQTNGVRTVPVGKDHYQSMAPLLTAGESITGKAWYAQLHNNP